MSLNIHGAALLFCSILTFSSGIFAIFQNPKSKINRSFFLLSSATTIWLFLYGINSFLFQNNYPVQNLLFRIGYCGVTFISVYYFGYILTLLSLSRLKHWVLINYFVGLIISFLILSTNHIIDGLIIFSWGAYPKAGTSHPIFLIYFLGLIVIGLIFLILKFLEYKNSGLHAKSNQIKYVFLSLLIFNFASLDFLPNYGIKFYPCGYIFATLFICITFYAIVKHKLMDMNIVIKKGLLYSTLVTCITLTYLVSILLFERFFQVFIGYQNIIISVSTAIITALIFIPLRYKIQDMIDKVFFKGTPTEIAEQNELLRREVAETAKSKAIATLASGMAHEIRNPLTAIKTFYDQFPEKKDDPQFLEKFKAVTGPEIDRIDHLIKDLLEFSKPSPLDLTKVNITQLLNDTLDLLSHQLKKNNITLTTKYEIPNTISLNADAGKLKQAFLNLFLNAIEAMNNGGTLSIDARTQETQALKITIKDTGKGIQKNNLKHIFEPFFSGKKHGTGLGLAITQGIIEEHSGKIKVESKIDEGTEFVVELPIEGDTL